jgi:flagellar protein FlgJ
MRLPATSAIDLAPSRATPRADVEKAARELETQFAQMLIKSMRSASPGNALGGDTRYRDMYDQQLARELGKGRGLGLAPMIMRQLEGGLAGSGATNAATPMPLARADAAPALPLASSSGGMLPLAPSRSGVSMPALAPQPSARAPAVARTTGAADASDPGQLDASSPEAFVQSIWPQAQKAAAELGVSPKALVAQAALETGWGRRLVGGKDVSSLNLFGIKASGNWKGGRVNARTHEFVGGKRVDEQAQFRAYGSVAESFTDYARLIGKPRYAAARGAGQDVRRFASALQQAGYATDPSYAAKITAIANGATLNRALSALPDAGARHAAAPAASNATTTVAALAVGPRG